ncbi:class I SAM-dependent methyltransferase [Truepera radiovictrix]|uniref:class I SAM-dependent methyltransferase n=1 Tax=Truepera radiovictrix TaxID=332249 RepID=UPI0003025CD4|nr:class I SAM-dependent methyltransferase [Truepera radiovictrix]WMT56451.1 class I SAM-dependent methyltransferase [Truepera radiovictrix]
MSAELFAAPVPFEEGIYRALTRVPPLPLAQRSNFWPATAALYEPLWRHRSIGLLTRGGFSTERELALMLSWLRPRPGETVLDAAASAGLYARTLLRHEPGLTVHALDLSLPFLQRAKTYAERDGIAPTLVHADVRALPYRDGVFDAVVCGGSPNEFTELPAALAEFARVLKPGGRLWLMYLSRAETLPGRLGQGLLRLTGLRFPEPEALEAAAKAVGLEPQRAQHRGRVALTLFRRT